MTESQEIDFSDLPPKIRDFTENRFKNQMISPSSKTNFYTCVENFEKEFLSAAYATNSENISRMALQLGMDRSHLHAKLKTYGIHPKSN